MVATAAADRRPAAERDRGSRVRLVDVARALREGEQALEPGLLAEANRGILYVDEINLLDDHLTDVLLDAAALGVNVVEREGVSVSHPGAVPARRDDERGGGRAAPADRRPDRARGRGRGARATRSRGRRWCAGARRSPPIPRRSARSWAADAGASWRSASRPREARLAYGPRARRALRGDRRGSSSGSGVESHRADITIARVREGARRARRPRDERRRATTCSRPPSSRSATGCRSTRSRRRRGFDDAELQRALEEALERGDAKKSAGRASRRRARRRSTLIAGAPDAADVDPARACSRRRRRRDRARARRGSAGARARSSAAGAASTRATGSRGPATATSRSTRRCARRPLAAARRSASAGRGPPAQASASTARRSASASSSTTAGRCTPSGWSRR